MFRILLLVHRYLSIAIGLLVALWCLSAFVMLYVQFPNLSGKERLAALPEIDLRTCCSANPQTFDLRSGEEISAVDVNLAERAAAA